MPQAKQSEKVYLLDTNIILRFLLDDHPRLSKKARRFMSHVSSRACRAEIMDVVLAECIYVMEKFYKIPRDKTADALIGVMNFAGIVNADKTQILDAMLKYKDSSFDIVDCLLAAHSSQERPVVSFDSDIQRLKAVQISLNDAGVSATWQSPDEKH